MYRCQKCGNEFENVSEGIIRCPSCAHKVLYRKRDPIGKIVSAD